MQSEKKKKKNNKTFQYSKSKDRNLKTIFYLCYFSVFPWIAIEISALEI